MTAEESLLALTDQSEDLVWVYDYSRGKFNYTNRAFDDFWGSYLVDFEDPFAGFHEATHPRGRSRRRSHFEAARDSPAGEIFQVKKPGSDSYRWFEETQLVRQTDRGNPLRWSGRARDVTEARQAKEDLRRLRTRFNQITESIDEVVYLTDHQYQQVLFLKKTNFEDVYGYPLEELPTCPWTALEVLVHPEDVDRARARTRQFVEDPTHPSTRLEFRIQHPDGSVRCVEEKMFRVTDDRGTPTRIAGLVEDVTERVRMQERLEERERRFREIDGSIDEVIWLSSPDAQELYHVSPNVVDLWGITREQFYDTPMRWTDPILDEDQKKLNQTLSRLPQEGFDIEFRLRRADGSIRWLRHEAFPVRDENGEVYRLAGISDDITDRKQLEESLQVSLQQKELLLKEVHHRVKNNMQVVSSVLGLESRRTSDEALRQVLTNCKNRIQSMALVHEHLYADHGIQEINLKEYLEELACTTLDSLLFEGNQRTSLDVQLPDEPLITSLDHAIPLGLVLNELITNAVQHGNDHPENRLRLKLARSSGSRARIEVADEGSGLPEDFDLETGSSLGLRLVDTLINDQLDGEITWENQGGARFTLEVPL